VDIWDFLDRNTSSSRLQYKKWLDVSSGHFSFKDYADADVKLVYQIVRRAKETFIESGRYLVYLSSCHHVEHHGELIPIFLTPVELEWHSSLKELSWTHVNSSFQLNQDLKLGQIVLTQNEIESWLNNQTEIENDKIKIYPASFYFDLNHKAFLQKDLFSIHANKITSQALVTLFNDEIIQPKIDFSPNFLSLVHALPMDFSQACAIEMASNHSCHIIGPPGTGKSQTIINLALLEMFAGKKVAIVSQKKAALDVISQRLANLNLQNFCLNLMQDNNINEFYTSLEGSLCESLEYMEIEVPERFNTTYYKHCIRTLEDFFLARKQHKEFSKVTFKANEEYKVSLDHPLFKIYYPNEKLIASEPIELINELVSIQNILVKNNIPPNISLELVASLAQPLKLFSKIDVSALKTLLKSRKIPTSIKKIEKERREFFKSRPKETKLTQLGKAKLDYYLSYLMSDKLFSKLFNSKVKEIIKEIGGLDNKWDQYKIWEKIDGIKQALLFLEWEGKMNELVDREKTIKSEILGDIEEESLKYVLDKLNSKQSVWLLSYDLWLKEDYSFQPEKWKELISSVGKMIVRNHDLGDWKVSKFVEINLSRPLLLKNSIWDELCSMNFKSKIEWENYLSGSTGISKFPPVLKNYNGREIIQMVTYARKYYSEYSQYQLDITLNNWNSERETFLNSLLTSRKKDLKFKRDHWKKSIQFLQKKWSTKRLKPTIFQALSKIDLDFLLWLKPLTIASLDKFSQYISLEAELYDTLIIDEASQIELIDSIPAIVRSKKVIVVGDGQQLTPSRFFQNQDFNFDQPHESLLELAEVKLPSSRLNYQYRAKFRELIQFSNTYFYKDQLDSTPVLSKDAICRIFLQDGVYHNRINTQEATQIIVELVKLALRNDPTKSVGVITFSVQQKDAILSRIEMESICNPMFRAALQKWEENREAFFVKSIEQVQGDERDIVFISIGYAKNEQGRLYQFFGPILKYKGENRLNVLMSRARERMIIVTSLISSQIYVKANSSLGLIRFKQLLSYVENLNVSRQTLNREPLNYWQYIFNPFKS
jgi:hypothetical protein